MTTRASIVRHRVPRRLRDLVVGIVGFDEVAPPGGRRRVQPAGSLLVLELSFTTPLLIEWQRPDAEGAVAFESFLAGLMARPVSTFFDGRHTSVQIYFTPMGASRILGVPARETVGRVVPLSDVVPLLSRDLPDELVELATWAERFAVVDRYLTGLAASAPPADPLAQWAWSELQLTGGGSRIADLAHRSGWSARQVRSRFGQAVGVSPKSAAQVIRFEHAHAELASFRLDLLAARHGYADQSHLSREVRRFAGESPLALARARRPTAHTALGETWRAGRVASTRTASRGESEGP